MIPGQEIENEYAKGFNFYKGRRGKSVMMVHSHKRLGHVIPVLNEKLAVAYSKYLEELKKLEEEEAKKGKTDDEQDGPGSGNQGKLVIDTTAVPQDIRHPNS